uniref:Uncharacterized protein n=1 Tax=Solanum tuberosum TaxID=4113 RepID=M1DNN0_SOLTU
MNLKVKGTLPSDTLSNLKTNGHCMAMVTRSRKILNDTKVMTKKVASEKVVNGVKLSAPIKSVIDENQVTEEYAIDDEENKDYPPSIVKEDEETKEDEFTKGDVDDPWEKRCHPILGDLDVLELCLNVKSNSS